MFGSGNGHIITGSADAPHRLVALRALRVVGAGEAGWWVAAPGRAHDHRAPTLGSGITMGARVITVRRKLMEAFFSNQFW
jgi:hypothetical protein